MVAFWFVWWCLRVVSLSASHVSQIGRYGYGKIMWPGLTDVRALDFDAIVDIEYKKARRRGQGAAFADPLRAVGCAPGGKAVGETGK